MCRLGRVNKGRQSWPFFGEWGLVYIEVIVCNMCQYKFKLIRATWLHVVFESEFIIKCLIWCFWKDTLTRRMNSFSDPRLKLGEGECAIRNSWATWHWKKASRVQWHLVSADTCRRAQQPQATDTSCTHTNKRHVHTAGVEEIWAEAGGLERREEEAVAVAALCLPVFQPLVPGFADSLTPAQCRKQVVI